MATMNISLPDPMKAWVEEQAKSGRYANTSDVVRDLIRREQIKAEKIAHWRKLIEEADASGVSDQSPREVIEELRAQLRRASRSFASASRRRRICNRSICKVSNCSARVRPTTISRVCSRSWTCWRSFPGWAARGRN